MPNMATVMPVATMMGSPLMGERIQDQQVNTLVRQVHATAQAVETQQAQVKAQMLEMQAFQHQQMEQQQRQQMVLATMHEQLVHAEKQVRAGNSSIVRPATSGSFHAAGGAVDRRFASQMMPSSQTMRPCSLPESSMATPSMCSGGQIGNALQQQPTFSSVVSNGCGGCRCCSGAEMSQAQVPLGAPMGGPQLLHQSAVQLQPVQVMGVQRSHPILRVEPVSQQITAANDSLAPAQEVATSAQHACGIHNSPKTSSGSLVQVTPLGQVNYVAVGQNATMISPQQPVPGGPAMPVANATPFAVPQPPPSQVSMAPQACTALQAGMPVQSGVEQPYSATTNGRPHSCGEAAYALAMLPSGNTA